MQIASPDATLPWVEKYRPQTLQEIVSQHDIIMTLTRFSDRGQFPHLLLHGPPGTGKTSTVQAIARKLYGNDFRQMVLELNASDDRGINVVRDIIKAFAETTPHLPNGRFYTGSSDENTYLPTPLKLVVLDEADQMTSAAQMALRRIIENFAQYVRFFIICNYVNKINPALQSRCTKFRFPPLDPASIAQRTRHICEAEGVKITDKGMETLIRISRGDMRKVLNSLQSAFMSNGERTVDDTVIFETVGFPIPSQIDRVLQDLTTASFQAAYTDVKRIVEGQGYSLSDVITCLYDRLVMFDLPIHTTWADESLQLGALVALFMEVRDALSKLKPS